jgi:hypothetical protein
MSTVICHASPIETLRGSVITQTGTANLSTISRRIKKLATSETGGNGLVAKEKHTRIRSPRMAVIWTKTLRPSPPKRQRVGLARVTHSKIPTKKGAFHTFLGPPTAKAQRAAMRSLNATMPKVRQYVQWSEVPVHWSREDHPEHIPDGYYAMVVVGDITPGIPKYPFIMTNIYCMTSFMCRDIKKASYTTRLGRIKGAQADISGFGPVY